jgi:hypothetical protein
MTAKQTFSNDWLKVVLYIKYTSMADLAHKIKSLACWVRIPGVREER